MREGRGYNPEESSHKHPKKVLSRLGRVVAGLGFALAADRSGVLDALDKPTPVASAEKSPTKPIIHNDHNDREPLLPHSRPNLDGVQAELLEDEVDDELEPQEDYDTDEAKAKRVEHAIRVSNIIGEKYNGILTVIYVDNAEESKVLLDTESPDIDDGDRSVIKYRLDDLGDCYMYGIGGEDDTKDGVLIKYGKNQGEEILSLIDSAIRLKEERERIFNQAIESLQE